ncbi:branched-chain amino acid transporter AzlD, partial [Micrococcus luteus]|nr:branched-chain amino acid transporter AzlD [Micrococcus luteus]
VLALVMLLDAAALAPGEPVDGARVAHALFAAAVTVVVHLLAGRRTLVSIAAGTLAYVLLVNLA